MKRPPTLRTILATFTFASSVIAIAVCVSLALLTALAHEATVTAAAGVRSVRLAGDAQLDLMLLARTDDPLAREDLVSDLRGKLTEARAEVTSDAEDRALAEALSQVDRMAAGSAQASETPRTLYATLGRVIALNTEQAEHAEARAAGLDQMGTLLGIVGGLLIFITAIGLVVWVRVLAFRPLLALSDVMRRFGRGDPSVRADESGPGEIREMAERFNEMASALAAQRHAQTAFLGGVAHDLRNPLAALKLAVGLLPDEAAEVAARIDRQVHRLERMIGDFLDAAKIEAGQLALRLDTADARSIAREAVGLFEGASSKHTIELAMPRESIPLRCDPLRLEQVLANLISNALKYSPDGGRISVSVRSAGQCAVFEVTDQGMGISQDDQRKLFEPFRRVGLSKGAIPGVGLGLFVVRQIVEAHGGRIEVTSSPGRGSTFRVSIGGVTNAREGARQASAMSFLRPRSA